MNCHLKKIYAVILSFILAFSSCVIAFGATTGNASSWAAPKVSEALRLGIMNQRLANKCQSNLTREEFCDMAVGTYKVITGQTGVTLKDSPFYDATSKNVAFCYEKGIVSGMSNVTFSPEYFVTREQMARITVNLLSATGISFDFSKIERCKFKDNAKMSADSINAINLLVKAGVINGYGGYFYPKSFVTVEQAATILVDAVEQFRTYDVKIGNKGVKIGEREQSVVSTFGVPAFKVIDDHGCEIYVYNSDYKNLICIGIKNGVVSEIFTNAKNASYRNVATMSISKAVTFAKAAETELGEVEYLIDSDFYSDIYLFYQSSDGYAIDSILIKDKDLTFDKKEYSQEIADSAEKVLFEIINAARTKYGVTTLKKTDDAEKIATAHSQDMRDKLYTSYTNKNELTPFERMKKGGIEFSAAAENISSIDGSFIEIYNSWMSNLGTKSNILDPMFTNGGIGSIVFGTKKYTTMDFYKAID